MVLGLEEFKITRVACGSSHSVAWAESDFPAPTTHEPVMFPASRDPLGASCLSPDSQEQSVCTEAESNEYGEHRHRPSLAKIVLSLNSNYERQQALSHILSALQIIYSRDAVVRALMDPHSFIRGESKPETEDDEVVSLVSVSDISIDDVTLTEVANGSRKLLLEGMDEFTNSLGHDDSRLLVELLKLAVAGRAGDNGREVLSEVLRALAQTKPEVSVLINETSCSTVRIMLETSTDIPLYYSTHCNTAQIWSWCTKYSSSVANRYPAIYKISCVGKKNGKIKIVSSFSAILKTYCALLSMC